MRRRKIPDPIRLEGDIVGIELTQGKVAWIDASDLALVAPYLWYAFRRGKNWYAATKIEGRTVTMQNFLMKPADGLEIDHICGESLWNFRWNLRAVSHRENMLNSRRCKGLACLRQTFVLGELPIG